MSCLASLSCQCLVCNPATVTATVNGVVYEFTYRGVDSDTLCVRSVGEWQWRDAFCYFMCRLDDGVPYRDDLYAVMDRLSA